MVMDDKNAAQECKLYKKRWMMLFIFGVCSIANYMQFLQYSIIADAIVKHYEVSYEAVNWTAMVFLLTFIACIFPGVYFINQVGIRKTLLLSTLATCAGAWIKVGGIEKDRFWIYILAQVIIGMAQAIIASLPVPVAASWFGESEVSTACSLGIFGSQLGVAFGFLIPSMVVHTNSLAELLKQELYTLVIGTAIFCTIIFAITFLFFQEEPPTPPSFARIKSKTIGKIEFLPSLLCVVNNSSYRILVVAYGINVGISSGFGMLLNQIILSHYPDAAKDAGRIGLIIVVSGMVGAITFGLTMDKYQKFRETTFCGYVGCFLGILILSFVLPHGLPIIYGVSVFVGFFMAGILPVGYEVAVELTYPVPECISTGFLSIMGQAIGIGFTYTYSFLLYKFGDLPSNLTTAGLLLTSSIVVLFIKFDLKRKKAETEGKINLYVNR